MSKQKNHKSTSSIGKRVLKKTDTKRVAKGKDLYGYGEQKKRLNLTLTPTAIEILSIAANKQSLSKSEFIEQWIRNELSSDTSD